MGGWLTGVTSAAGKLRSYICFVPNAEMPNSTLVGVVLGGAVRGGTKALQRLTAQERLQDLHAASQHLEATASGGTLCSVICLVQYINEQHVSAHSQNKRPPVSTYLCKTCRQQDCSCTPMSALAPMLAQRTGRYACRPRLTIVSCSTAGLRGEARVQTLQKWCALLQELHPNNLPLLHCYTVYASHPSSPHHSSCDSEWQQLQLPAPPEPPDPDLGYSAAPMPSSQHQKPVPGSSPSTSTVQAGVSQQGHGAKGSELDFWANQVLYLDQEAPDTEKELLTFRELFLRSYALENIIVGGS